MSDALQIIFIFVIMVLVMLYTRKIRALKMIKARDFIIEDLKSKGAGSPETGVELPYAHKNMLKIGFRDDRPKVLSQLIKHSVVGVTEKNLFYLNEPEIALQPTKDM